MDMELYSEVPIASNYKGAVKRTGRTARKKLRVIYNIDFVSNVQVYAGENAPVCCMWIYVPNEHDLKQGEVFTLRNLAVMLLQDGGLVKTESTMRPIKVRIVWCEHGFYQYIFRYGEGWEVLNAEK